MTRLNVSKAREEVLMDRLGREEMDRKEIERARAALKEAREKRNLSLRELMHKPGD